MEKRKLWRTGKGTYVVSLPIKWSEELIKKYGDEVSLSFQEERAIILPAGETAKEGKITAAESDDILKLESEIIASFISDVERLYVEIAEDKKSAFLEKILYLKNKLEGMSILNISPTQLLITFSEMGKSVVELLDTMYSYFLEFYNRNQFIMSEVPTKSEETLKKYFDFLLSVENEIDTTTFHIKRLVNKGLIFPEYLPQIRVNDVRDILQFYSIATNLERLCDLEVELFNEIRKLNAKNIIEKEKVKLLSSPKGYDVRTYHADACRMVNLAYEGFKDQEKALQVLRTRNLISEIEGTEIEYRGDMIPAEKRKIVLDLAKNHPKFSRELVLIEQKIWGITGISTNVAENIMNLYRPQMT